VHYPSISFFNLSYFIIKLEEEPSPDMMRKIIALKKVQNDAEDVDLEYKKERIALEQKYRALKEPIHETRDKIISGEVDVPKEPWEGEGDEPG
jgi:hypothetical protein